MDTRQASTLATTILEKVGGKENVKSVIHCLTRLRFSIQDVDKVDREGLSTTPGVLQTLYQGGQFQIVIGTEVEKVYDALMIQLGELSAAPVETAQPEKKGLFVAMTKRLSEIFAPILPAIITAGLLNALTAIIDTVAPGSGLVEIVRLVSGTAYTFLPVLVCWSTVISFGGSPIMGIVMGLIMVHPDLINPSTIAEESVAVWNVFGLQVSRIGYHNQVLPALVVGIILAKLQLTMEKRTPKALHQLITKPMVLLITSLLTFLAVGPIMLTISNGISWLVQTLTATVPVLAGILIGGTWEIMVLCGLQYMVIALMIQMIATNGVTVIFPLMAMSCLSQGVACLAVSRYLPKSDRSAAITAGITANFGVTEPAIFGVNLKYRFPFIFGLIATALANIIISASGAASAAIAPSGILSLLVISGYTIPMALGALVAACISGIGTTLYARRHDFSSL